MLEWEAEHSDIGVQRVDEIGRRCGDVEFGWWWMWMYSADLRV